MSEIWGIVLAAGESKRMKAIKMLLPFAGKTILGTVIENISGSDTYKNIVVTGAYREEIEKVTELYPVVQCYNDDYKNGMLSSVKCGFRSIPQSAEAVIVLPGDQPDITADLINMVISAYRKTGKGIVLPVYKNKRGHPILIDASYKNEIEKLDPEIGLRSLLQIFPDDVFEVEASSPAILKDIDTREEYINANQIG